MTLRRLAVVPLAALMIGACDADEPDDADSFLEPDAALGETIVYRGAADTDAAWELQVVVDRFECDVDVSNGVEIGPGEGRFCAAHLTMVNTGQEPNVGDFSRSSFVLVDDGRSYLSGEIVSFQYADEQGLDPLLGILPGETAESALVFSIDDDAEPTLLHLQADTDDEFAVIDLASAER